MCKTLLPHIILICQKFIQINVSISYVWCWIISCMCICITFLFCRISTLCVYCKKIENFQSWLCLWLHALLYVCVLTDCKLKIHVSCCYIYNVTTDILWPFYFPSHMIYYINFYVLYHVFFFFFIFCYYEC